MRSRRICGWVASLLAAAAGATRAGDLDLPPEVFLAAERARIGAPLSDADVDLLAQHRHTINHLAVLDRMNDKTFQAANGHATQKVVLNADLASAAAGGRMNVQAANPAKSGGSDSGGDVDTLNRNFISPLQVVIAQRAFNDRMNIGLPAEERKDNWHKKLDVDFMAHTAGIKDKDFKIVAALNTDAYKSRAAADYEALSRDPKKPPIPPAITAAYAQEMKGFADKKQKQVEAARKELATKPNDRETQAKLAILEGQQMKYINRLATATDRALQEKGKEPVSAGIARAADLGARRGPVPTDKQAEALGKQGKDFQAERAKVRADAPNLLAKAVENFEKNKSAMGIPNTPPPLKSSVDGTFTLKSKEAEGRAQATTAVITDGEGRKIVEKTITSQDGRGNYVGSKVTETVKDPNPKAVPLPDQRFGGKVQDLVNRNVQESKIEIERIKGSQKDAGFLGVGKAAVVQQDKASVTKTTPFGLVDLVGTSQKSTTRESYATGGENPWEVATTRSRSSSSGFSYESDKKQGSVTWEYGRRDEYAFSKEAQKHGSASQPENKANWKVPGVNVKLFERSHTNVVYNAYTNKWNFAGGQLAVKGGSVSSVWTLSGTANERNAKLDLGYSGSANLVDVKQTWGKPVASPGQGLALNPYGSLSGTVGGELRAGLGLSGGEDGLKLDASASAFVGGKAKAEAGFNLDARNTFLPVSIGYRGSLEARAGLGLDASAGAQLGWGGFKLSGKLAGAAGFGGGMSHSIDVDVSKLTLGVDMTEVERKNARSAILSQYRQGLERGDLVLLPGQTAEDLLKNVNKAVDETMLNGAPLPPMEKLGVVPQHPAVVLNQMKTRFPRDSDEGKILARLDEDLRSGDPDRQNAAAEALRDIRAADQYGISMPVSTGMVFANGGGNLRVDPKTGKSGLPRDLDDLNTLMGQTRPGSDEARQLDHLADTLQHGTPMQQFEARRNLEILRGQAHDDPNWAKHPGPNPFQAYHDAEDRARLEALKGQAKPGTLEWRRLEAIEKKLSSNDPDDRNSAWADLNQAQREEDQAAQTATEAAAEVERQAQSDFQRLNEAAGYAAPGSDEEKAVGILAGRMKNGTPAEREKAREQLDRLLEAQREHAGIREAVAQAGPDAVPTEDFPAPAPGPRWSQSQLTSHNERMENLGAGYLSDLEKLQAERARARSPEERARLDAAIAKKKEDVAWVSDQIAQNDTLLRDEFGVQPPAPTPEELEAERNRQASIAATAEANEAKLGKSAMKSHDPAKVLEIFTQIDSNRAARARAQAQAGAIGQALSDEPPPTLPAGPSRWTNEGLDNDIGNMRNLQGHTQEDIDRLREAFANSRNSTERNQLLQDLADKQAELDALQRRIEEDLAEKERNKRAGLGGGVDWSEGPSDGDGAGPADVTSAGGLVNDLANERAGEGIGSGSGDDGGAAVEGGVIGGDVAGNTRRTRDEFTTRDGAHKGDKDASMETGEANPLADLTNAVNSVKGVVEGVRGGLEGVRDVKDQLDELRGHDEESEPPLPPERTTEPNDPTDPPERSGEKTPPRATGGSEPRTPEKVRRPPAGGGGGGVSKPPPVVRTGNPPTQPPPQGPSGATGYAVFLQGGNFLGAGPMENYQNRKAAFAQSGKPMDWFIQAGPFGSSQVAHKWILDNSEPGGSGGFMTGSRIYKGKTVRVRENLESYAQ